MSALVLAFIQRNEICKGFWDTLYNTEIVCDYILAIQKLFLDVYIIYCLI